MTDGEQISRQLSELAAQFSEHRKDLTELRIAFASLKATVDSQQQALKSEMGNMEKRNSGTTEVNWKWVTIGVSILLALLGIIMASTGKK